MAKKRTTVGGPPERLEVKVHIDPSFHYAVATGDINTLIERLQNIHEHYGHTRNGVLNRDHPTKREDVLACYRYAIEEDVEYDYYDCSCSGGNRVFRLVGWREETDAEYEKRCAKLLKAAEKRKKDAAAKRKQTAMKKVRQEEKERELYERLREKYGE